MVFGVDAVETQPTIRVGSQVQVRDDAGEESFRIVNAEFSELAAGLAAAERALKPGGQLAVVTFHSIEDRIVKRFFQVASGKEANANRYAPATTQGTSRR